VAVDVEVDAVVDVVADAVVESPVFRHSDLTPSKPPSRTLARPIL
jgi:hypothetical protein